MARTPRTPRPKYDGPTIDVSAMALEQKRSVCQYAYTRTRTPKVFGSLILHGQAADGHDAMARNNYLINLGGHGMWWQDVPAFEAANRDIVELVDGWLEWFNANRRGA